MANDLNVAFLRCALGPVKYASSCLQSGQVPNGLRELAAENLHGGFKRGVEEAARNVGVEITDVEGLLPLTEVNVASVRLETVQKAAINAWTTYTGQVGGMLTSVTDLTVDGRTPDIANALERLSQKVRRDKPLSEPLHALSVELDGWVQLVERCGDLLANGEVLKNAHRVRRIRRGVVAGLVIVTVAALLPLGLGMLAARARVDAALGAGDPCAVFTVAPRDLERASSAQQERAAALRATCADLQRQAAEAREAAARAEEKAREEAQARKEREAKCDALAAHMAAGDVPPEDAAVADGKGVFLLHVAKRALASPDMSESALPCTDTPAGAKIKEAFAAAVLASPAAWANADDISARVAGLLVEHREELPKKSKDGLVTHADLMVKRAMLVGSPAATDQAVRLCKLKDDLEIQGSKFCPALAKLKASGKL
jgi:hypothetical protein